MSKSKINNVPTKWIVKQIKLIAPQEKIQILDFASGNGRNSIHLATKNRIITAIDKDSQKLNNYKNFNYINTICFDLETNKKWPLNDEYYDIVIVVNYLYRPKIRELLKLLKNGGYLFYETFSVGNERYGSPRNLNFLLKDGGYLFYETFSVGNEKYGSPKNPDFLLKDRELINLFSKKNEILSYFNGIVIEEKVSIKQRCLIKKTS